MKVELVENAYFRINNKVDVFFIVPLFIIIGIFTMAIQNYLLMLFCFVCGFIIKGVQ